MNAYQHLLDSPRYDNFSNMGRNQIAERLLEAAKKVAATEAASKAARQEYDLLFRQAIQGSAKRAPRTPVPRHTPNPIPVELTPANTTHPNGNGHLATVEDRVFLAIRENRAPTDAKAIAQTTQIAENTVRWAFTVLMEAARIRRVSRGKYEVTE
jgi:hypothetical protein